MKKKNTQQMDIESWEAQEGEASSGGDLQAEGAQNNG